MNSIVVKGLNKQFKQYKKSPGLKGSFKSVLKRDYYFVNAVKDLSFDIEQGEFVGLIGLNGAGKTTTLKCLSGIIYPTSGSVNVIGYTPWERKKDFLKQISFVMGQKSQLWWDLPAIDSFLLHKEIYEIPESVFEKNLANLVGVLDIANLLEIQVRKLSLGQRMRFELVASLLHSPRVIYLDEPTIGLDVLMQRKLREFLHDYNKDSGATILLTSHNMDDVSELVSRMLIINQGKLIFDGKLKELHRKYANERSISIVSSKKMDIKDLEKYGEIKKFDGFTGVISVKPEDVPRISSEILKNLPIEDLEINEVSLDEVVRRVYAANL